MGIIAATWGLAGVALLLGSATYRLSFPAAAAFSHPFQWYHWAALLVSVVFMAYSEAYRGFQQGFSPRVVARARYLRANANLPRTIFAPLFCMGYFHAIRKRKIVAYGLTAGIVVLIITVRGLSQPWRGIIDVGVVMGLAWGLGAIAVYAFRAFAIDDFDHPTDVPTT